MNALRTGFTTGTCAAAAARAAVMGLCGQPAPAEVEVRLPEGGCVRLPVTWTRSSARGWEAAVRKDAGSDPDVTHGALVVASAEWAEGSGVTLEAGEGIGRVTRPGLAVPKGRPAINPVPRRMIEAAAREVTNRPVKITLSIPGGCDLAEKTFNPRLGVVGGLSILGTSGRVRPFSLPALREALKCAVNVAAACGVQNPVLVPGRIGARAARRHFHLRDEQVIEAGNEWEFVLQEVARRNFDAFLVMGHPGKLAKLAMGEWQTHSSRSAAAAPMVARLAEQILGRPPAESSTVEAVFEPLAAAERERLGNALAEKVRIAIGEKMGQAGKVATLLINLKGDRIGQAGDLSPWEKAL